MSYSVSKEKIYQFQIFIINKIYLICTTFAHLAHCLKFNKLGEIKMHIKLLLTDLKLFDSQTFA